MQTGRGVEAVGQSRVPQGLREGQVVGKRLVCNLKEALYVLFKAMGLYSLLEGRTGGHTGKPGRCFRS